LPFEQGAALGTVLAALFALWLAERRSRFDARRAFVEFTLRQRTTAAAELMAALAIQMQYVEQACYWQGELPNLEAAERERNRVRDELLPVNTKRMNEAIAAAELAFSPEVTRRTNALVEMFNSSMRGPGVPVFDRTAALSLHARIAAALRDEMLFPEVLEVSGAAFQADVVGAPFSARPGFTQARGLTKDKTRRTLGRTRTRAAALKE
jgi:hypothetical protein